ncbi:hypothetical protein V2J09_019922 [Rumex salicifolius]
MTCCRVGVNVIKFTVGKCSNKNKVATLTSFGYESKFKRGLMLEIITAPAPYDRIQGSLASHLAATMQNLMFMVKTMRWVLSQMHIMDLALSLVGLFLFVSIRQRVSTKGPMMFVEYSFKTMQSLVHEKLLRLAAERATQQISSSSTVDLQDWLLRFTFDSVCIIALGVDPGCLALDLPEIAFARAMEDATEYSLFRFIVPPFCWKPMRWLSLGKEKKLKEAVKVIHEFADRTLKNRKAENNTQHCSDLLSRLLELQKNGDKGFNLSDKFLRELCISFILAGRDTTSIALTWFFWLVHEHPAVEKKILEEIKDILKSSPSRREGKLMAVLEADQLDKMVYLEAALSETMRLYPPVPIDFKEVAEDDVYPDGMEISKGGRVFYHIYAMGRTEALWGHDCQQFRPERWMREGKLVCQNQFKYLVFNAGPRLCPGKKFAYTQMKMVAASLLLRYKVKVKEGHPVAKKVTTTLYMKHGLQLYVLLNSGTPQAYNLQLQQLKMHTVSGTVDWT